MATNNNRTKRPNFGIKSRVKEVAITTTPSNRGIQTVFWCPFIDEGKGKGKAEEKNITTDKCHISS